MRGKGRRMSRSVEGGRFIDMRERKEEQKWKGSREKMRGKKRRRRKGRSGEGGRFVDVREGKEE